MKLVENADGTIQVIELDPAKMYWIVLEAGSRIDPKKLRFVNGLILVKSPEETIGFIEHADRIRGARVAGKPPPA